MEKLKNIFINNQNVSQNGQIVILLLLITLVALTIGLVITQRSVSNVLTSSQTEQSARAFSAAEAGLELAFQSPSPISASLSLGNESSVTVDVATAPTGSQALEYPPVGKETTIQFWLADPSETPPENYYLQPSFDIYFGNEWLGERGGTDPDYGYKYNAQNEKVPIEYEEQPAIEVNVISRINSGSTPGTYESKKYFFDSARGVSAPDTERLSRNGFCPATCGSSVLPIASFYGTGRQFYCMVTVPPTPPDCNTQPAVEPGFGPYQPSPNPNNVQPIMARVRFFYSDEKQKIALSPRPGATPPGNILPPQAKIFTSTGVAGDSQKQIRVFRMPQVALPFFDYAIFANGNIEK